jgi:hypothetical protein
MKSFFVPRANLLDKSSAAQSLDRSLKGRLHIPLLQFLGRPDGKSKGNPLKGMHHKFVRKWSGARRDLPLADAGIVRCLSKPVAGN